MVAMSQSRSHPAAVPVELVQQRHLRARRIFCGGLAFGLGLAALLAAGWGAVPIPPTAICAILLAQLGIDTGASFTPQQETVLLAIRLPRVALAVLTGAGLSAAGATLQGLFRNPLADPALIGVSSGAAAAAAAAATIVLGARLLAGAGLSPFHVLPVTAFAGGLVTTLLVYRIGVRSGHADTATMLLAGVAINAIALAVIGLLSFMSDDRQLRDLSLWLLGSLGGATWSSILPALPFLLLPIALLPRLGRALNALLLGSKDALYLGFDPAATTRQAVALGALVVGASVALTGVISFVGLLVPHLVRLLIGPDHRILLPASMALGAILVLMADLIARTIVVPAELPIGVITSLVGGPFFLWLLLRGRALSGW